MKQNAAQKWLEKWAPRLARIFAAAFLVGLALRVSILSFEISGLLGWPPWVDWLIFAVSSGGLLTATILFVRKYLFKY